MEKAFRYGYLLTGFLVAFFQLIYQFIVILNKESYNLIELIFPLVMCFGIIIYYKLLPSSIDKKEEEKLKTVMLHYLFTGLVLMLYIILNKHVQYLFILPILISFFIGFINYKKIYQEKVKMIVGLLLISLVLTNLGLLINDLLIGKIEVLTIVYMIEFIAVFLYSIYYQIKYLKIKP